MARKHILTTAGAITTTAALLLTGCTGSSDEKPTTTSSQAAAVAPSSKPPLDANGLPTADIVKQAVIATRQLSAAHVKLAVDPGIAGLPMKSVDAVVQKEGEVKPGAAPGGVAAKGKATIRIDDKYVDVEFVVVSETVYVKIPPATTFKPMGRSGDTNTYDPAVILDNNRGLLNVLDNLADIKIVERQTLAGGVDTVKATGTIAAKTLDPLLPNVTEVIAKGGGDAAKVPVTVWVTDRKDDNTSKPLIAKLEVDMKGKPITLELSDFDEKTSISKP